MLRALALLAVLAGCSVGAVPDLGPRVAGLVPDGGGLQPAGSDLRIDFGRDKAGVVEAVSRLLSARPGSDVVNAECGAGPVNTVSWDGLDLTFMDGDFLGWIVDDAALAAAGGLRVGQTRAALEAAGAGPFRDTSLGVEFESGGVFGLLETDGGDAPVTLLWSGLTCFFR